MQKLFFFFVKSDGSKKKNDLICLSEILEIINVLLKNKYKLILIMNILILKILKMISRISHNSKKTKLLWTVEI